MVISGPTFPICATVSGVEVVTIPATEYAELVDCRRRLAERAFQAQRFMSPLRSRIARDPEVAVFVTERLGLMTIAELMAAISARFGPKRTPSSSSIHRYLTRLRKARRASQTG